ncbi:hypothetical protein FD19_GL001718 [Lacticaseibacillus thailandensis DSM 22698 = JCM 13996]|uniref:AP2 domain-containing protein n=2 Tax=Lacticaseibacillus thailandensis TaxID=381741 RepID=A0A0R2C5V7_9LACO|nr:hypothetical protein FD19_GL001718 [Lacticaseibacillus thailandensis DSM 22698 = JCM 13996]
MIERMTKMKRVDMTGRTFARLTVLKYAGNDPHTGNAQWLCQCVCGRQVVVDGYRLRKGMTRSCGCLRSEVARRSIMHNEATRAQMQTKNCTEDIRFGIMMTRRRSNHSGVVGVCYDKKTDMWVARMMYKGKLVLNQRSKDFDTARRARMAAEIEYLGRTQSDALEQAIS